MNYWLDLFTGPTWDEFRTAGANVSGFLPRRRRAAGRIKAGDILLCYLTGVMRWVGALEVIGPSRDQRHIWKDADFPVRLDVKPLVVLNPEHGVPMAELEGKVHFYKGPGDRGKFKAFVRMSPNLFDDEDGKFVLELLKQAYRDPIVRPVDPKKLARKPFYKAERKMGRAVVHTLVSVPEDHPDELLINRGVAKRTETTIAATRHTEIQHSLLWLGAEMGFQVWVARNDKSKPWAGQILSEMPGVVSELPTQFNEVTNRTIELIDVLWLKGNSIAAAFEIECTTSVYSGLLRMSDLLALQPNLQIRLFLVAPDDRREKVQQEILRPTFELREKPLAKLCGFIRFSTLTEKLAVIKQHRFAKSLTPNFLEETAEYFFSENEKTPDA